MAQPPQLEVLVCSSNIGNTQMTAAGMKNWIFSQGQGNGKNYDVVAIGMQEASFTVDNAYSEQTSAGEPLSPEGDGDDSSDDEDEEAEKDKEKGTKSQTGMLATAKDAITGKCGKYIEGVIQEVLGKGYYLVESIYAVQMRLYVFAKTDHKKHITEVQKAKENTGLGRVVANKGGQIVKLAVYGTTLCFVSCHLAAHEGAKHLANRNDSVREIFQGARMGNKQLDAASQFHHCFFMGDMNYRTNLSMVEKYKHLSTEGKNKDDKKKLKKEQFEIVTQLVADLDDPAKRAEAHQTLMDTDELKGALDAKKVLAGWLTAKPEFKPTFKVYRWEALKYVTKRTPSYCDRILWKSLPGFTGMCKQNTYEACGDYLSSDHKPIRAGFTIDKLQRQVASGGAPKLQITISDIEFELQGNVTKTLDTPDTYFKVVSFPPQVVKDPSQKDGVARTRYVNDMIKGKLDDKIVCNVHADGDSLWKCHIAFVGLDNNHLHKDRPLGSATLELEKLKLVKMGQETLVYEDLNLNGLEGGFIKCKVKLEAYDATRVGAAGTAKPCCTLL